MGQCGDGKRDLARAALAWDGDPGEGDAPATDVAGRVAQENAARGTEAQDGFVRAAFVGEALGAEGRPAFGEPAFRESPEGLPRVVVGAEAAVARAQVVETAVGGLAVGSLQGTAKLLAGSFAPRILRARWFARLVGWPCETIEARALSQTLAREDVPVEVRSGRLEAGSEHNR